MSNKNDRWSALSMKERADLMNMYITNGISDLKEMKKHYNSFGEGGDTESPVDGEEIEASIITPRQSRINKRRMRKELFTKIKSTLESNGDIIQLYNELPEDQRKRALESIMKFSSAANPKIVKDWFVEEVKKHPLKAIKALNYVITGEGQPVLFEPNRKYAYNGLFGGDYYYDQQPPIDNGIIDAMLYNREINTNIGVQADKQDYGPEVDYINRVYPDKNIQYIETKPGIDLNQEGIQPTIYYGAEGSFRTSLPKRVINNAGIIIQEGIRNDSTFVRGLDVYDFKPDDYISKWVDDSSMLPIIKQIDEDTNPVAIKTPWVYKDDINDIISSRTGLNGFEFNTIDDNKSVYKIQKSLGGKLNSFSGEENHPIEVQQGLQNGTIKAIKKDDGTYAYIRQEKPIEDLTQSIAEWTAAGDLMDAGVAIDAVRKGDLKQAALLAGLAFVPNGLEKVAKLISRPIKNAKKISKMKEMYTGVPHRVTSNDPHISMDDSFPTYNGTIWTTDSPYLAKHYAEDTGKVFKVLTDPSELHILETPKPVKGEYFPWAHLPYTYDSGIKITDSKLIDSGILPSIEEGLKFKKAVLSNSNSDKNVELIKNQEFLKGRIGGGKTDNIVENAYIDGFDGVNFYGIYDGPHLKDGYYIDTPTNETVLNPHTPHIVLPENKSKWSLLFRDLDKKTVLKRGGKLLTKNRK